MKKNVTGKDLLNTEGNVSSQNHQIPHDLLWSHWEMTEVFKHINIGFFSRDILAGKYIRFTENCANIYGYSINDFLSNTDLWFQIIHPDDKTLAEKEFEVLEKGLNSEAEYRIIHKDGSIKWIEVKALPMFNDGKLVRVDGIVSDITDRKNAEEQVVKARELSDIVMQTLPGIFYMYNSEGRFKYWNKQFETVTEYGEEEIKSLHPIQLFLEEEKALLAEKIASVFKTGKDEVEALLLTKSGKKIPYYFTGQKVLVDGEACLVGLGVDITERKKSEEALQKNEEMLSHILNSIPQSIFWKDTNSTFLGCNTVFAKATGLPDTASVVGKTHFDFGWDPEVSRKYQEEDLNIMKSQQPQIHHIESMQKSSGEAEWVDSTKIPLKDKNGKVYGILGIFEDITARKQEEEKQRKITADLIQRNIGLRQFSYMVSHHLRTPVSKILGLTSILEAENEMDAVNRELIGYIGEEGKNLDRIVRDLNSILSLQDTDITTLERVHIQKKLDEVLEAFQQVIPEIEATITSDFSSAPEIKTVASYFYCILHNLLSNSIKYRKPEKQLKIHISTTVDNPFTCLCFKDNGLGIDLEKYGQKIFGLYNRFHSVKVEGKGVGLYLIKAQIEALGGKIEVESIPESGSTFKVYFPLN